MIELTRKHGRKEALAASLAEGKAATSADSKSSPAAITSPDGTYSVKPCFGSSSSEAADVGCKWDCNLPMFMPLVPMQTNKVGVV